MAAEIRVLAVGRLRPALRQVADEYLKRLRRYLPVSERELRESSKAGSPVVQRRDEARRLREALAGTPALIVALTRGGEPWSSAELARRVGRWRDASRPVAFLIGGAEGLEPGLAAEATHRWSLGPLTLPHEVARVVVLEQLYRAGTILAGERYHKGT
jgi:23S rRNA (pseudouridine1915-N3)-methyltransferase